MLIAIAGRKRSWPTHTPTTTTRDSSGALSTIDSITPGTPTHSKITGCFGPGAELLGRAPDVPPADRQPTQLLARADRELERGGEVGQVPALARRGVRGVLLGSTTTSAPHARASSRRPGEKSLATTVRTPLALSIRITPRPTGPQPITIATCRLPTSPRRTACQATAIGSVSAATSGASPFGTASIIDSWDDHLLRVGPRRLRRQPDRVDPARAPDHRQRDDRGAGRQSALQPAPYSATRRENSCPKTSASWERPKRS